MTCQGKIALVTGCTGGIGMATAEKLIREGAEIYMLVRRVEYGRELAAKLNEAGPGRVRDVLHFEADDLTTIDTALQAAYQDAGRIDIFINNAIGTGGARPDNHTIAGTSEATLNMIFQAIVGVTAACMRAVIPMMIQGGGGSIVNVSSTTSVHPDMTRSYYGACKTMVNMITRDTAVQYGRQGIRCNAVLPAFTVGANTLNSLPKEFVEQWLKHCPIRRLGRPEDQANAIVFLASDEAAWITGQLLEVSGGYGICAPVFGDIVEGGQG